MTFVISGAAGVIGRRKPMGVMSLNRNHHLYRHLAFAVVPGVNDGIYPRDLVTGIIPTEETGDPRAIATEPNGRCLQSAASSEPGLLYGRTGFDDLNSTQGLTVIFRARKFVNGGNKWVFASGENIAGDGFEIGLDDQLVATNSVISNSNNVPSTRTASDALGANSELRWHDIAFTQIVTNTVGAYYLNGVRLGGETVNSIIDANASRTTKLWARRNVTNLSDSLGISYIYAFRRVLTPSEIMSMYISPFQLIQQNTKVYFMPVAAAGGATIPLFHHHYQTMRG